MKKSEIFLLIFFMVLSLFAIFFSILDFPESKDGVPGPKIFPIITGCLILISTISLFIKEFIKKQSRKQQETFIEQEEHIRDFIKIIIPIMMYVLVMPFLGFVVSTFLFQTYSLMRYTKYRWYNILGGALLIASVIYIVFKLLLRVPLDFGFLI